MECSEVTPRLHERVQNPMWLDPILELVFSFLPKAELSQCRLVCRQWRDVSERHFITSNRQSGHTVHLTDTASTLSFLSTFVGRDVVLTHTEDRSPWPRFLVDFFEICPIQRQLFLNVCGDTITWIKISPGILIDIAGLLATLLRTTPKLQSLEFSSIFTHNPMIEYASLSPWNQRIPDFFQWFDTLKNDSQPSIFPGLRRFCIKIHIEEDALEDTERFFSTLFQLMPHLQDFGVFELDVGKPWLADRVIPAIIQALQSQLQTQIQLNGQKNLLGPLANLQLPYLDTADIHHLHHFNLYHSLRLDTLWLASFRERIQSQVLLSFLQGQAETLRKLVLSTYTASLFLFLPLSLRMDRVSTLELLRVGKTTFVPDILVHFPNLSNLTIRPPQSCMDNNYVYGAPSAPSMGQIMQQQKVRMQSVSSMCEKLSDLTFSYDNVRDELNTLERIIKGCPNVVNLDLTVGSKRTVRLVLARLLNLRRLVIRFRSRNQIKNKDSCFTGVDHPDNLPSSAIPIMKNFQGRDRYVVHPEIMEQSKTFPSLVLLKDLRALEIYEGGNFEQSPASFVSDNMVLTVLMKMPQIRELTINQSSISPACLRILNTTLNLEKCLVCDKLGQVIPLKTQAYDEAVGDDRDQSTLGGLTRQRPLSQEYGFSGLHKCCIVA